MADPKTSKGAREERAAMRDHLRRRMAPLSTGSVPWLILDGELAWVLGRQKRYDRAKGGLGRTKATK